MTGRRPVTAEVDGQPATLVGDTLEVPVSEGQNRAIAVTWPAPPVGSAEYDLLFDLEKAGRRPASGIARYAAGSPNPPDDAYSRTLLGLEAWLRQVVDPGEPLRLDADASFERPSRDQADLGLSERRLEVAQGILTRLRAQGEAGLESHDRGS